MLYDVRQNRIPIVSEEQMRQILKPQKKKYNPKEAIKKAKRRLRKEGFFII